MVVIFSAELSEHHLQCIYEDSYDVRSKWYNVGLTLRLKSSTLDAIKANFDTCEEQYRECLKEWLKQDTHVKSMKVFTAALRDRTVKEESLANQLEMRYSRQNSPQQGNTVSYFLFYATKFHSHTLLLH